MSIIPEIQLDLIDPTLDDGWVDVDPNAVKSETQNKGLQEELAVDDQEHRKSRTSLLNPNNGIGNSIQEGNYSENEGRLEDQMNYDHLRLLEQIFEEADQDGKLQIHD